MPQHPKVKYLIPALRENKWWKSSVQKRSSLPTNVSKFLLWWALMPNFKEKSKFGATFMAPRHFCWITVNRMTLCWKQFNGSCLAFMILLYKFNNTALNVTLLGIVLQNVVAPPYFIPYCSFPVILVGRYQSYTQFMTVTYRTN
jgi:hypothetical protein